MPQRLQKLAYSCSTRLNTRRQKHNLRASDLYSSQEQHIVRIKVYPRSISLRWVNFCVNTISIVVSLFSHRFAWIDPGMNLRSTNDFLWAYLIVNRLRRPQMSKKWQNSHNNWLMTVFGVNAEHHILISNTYTVHHLSFCQPLLLRERISGMTDRRWKQLRFPYHFQN